MTNSISQPPAAMRGYRYKHGDRPLDGYTIQRAAGRGGFGEVYYAISDSGREVALKVVLTYEQIELRGIGQCMNLKSPHLVNIFDVRDGIDGQPIVIMEYVAGPSLRELMDEAPSGLGAQKSAFFLREIGKGLSYLHDCGIVHRDLKPANIFYENGYVKIGDYGLSKAISSSHRSGQTMTVGTVHYMAPEVGAGKYDRSIDIYALGALLYEMLTGQPPFYGASAAEVLIKHIGTAVDVSGVQEPFASVIRKALAKDPAQRYATVQEMVEAVFGAEDVRQSVSSFSPDSLTLVAGRVADRAGIRANQVNTAGRPMSSRAFDLAADERDLQGGEHRCGWADRFGARIARLTNRLGGIGDGIATIVGAKSGMSQSMAAAASSDLMPTRHRHLLVFVAILAVAVIGGISSAGYRHGPNPVALAALVFLMTAGGTVGVTAASQRLLPALEHEPWLLRQLAAGGIASILCIAMSIPAWVPLAHASMNIGEIFAAIALGLFVIDWKKRTRPNRPERVSLGDLINCLIVGGVSGAMLDANVPVVIAVLCGISMASQVAAPWFAMRAAPRDAIMPTQPLREEVAPKALKAPAASAWDQNEGSKEHGMNVTRVALGPLKIFSSARASESKSSEPRDGSFFGSLVRLPFAMAATAMLLAALAAACALAFDVPGLLASGRFDSSMRRDLQEAFHTTEPQRALRLIGGAAMFVLALVGSVLLMMVRRRRGGIHMMRVAAGAVLLLCSPFILAGAGIAWSTVEFSPRQDWSIVLDEFQSRITTMHAIRAGVTFIAGVLLLLWPARAHWGKRHAREAGAPMTPPPPTVPGAAI